MFHINIVLNTHRKVSMADNTFKTVGDFNTQFKSYSGFQKYTKKTVNIL